MNVVAQNALFMLIYPCESVIHLLLRYIVWREDIILFTVLAVAFASWIYYTAENDSHQR